MDRQTDSPSCIRIYIYVLYYIYALSLRPQNSNFANWNVPPCAIWFHRIMEPHFFTSSANLTRFFARIIPILFVRILSLSFSYFNIFRMKHFEQVAFMQSLIRTFSSELGLVFILFPSCHCLEWNWHNSMRWIVIYDANVHLHACLCKSSKRGSNQLHFLEIFEQNFHKNKLLCVEFFDVILNAC